jgi:hypothetical protein
MERERNLHTLEQENSLLIKKLEQNQQRKIETPDMEEKYAQAFALFKKKQAEEMAQYKKTIYSLEQKIKEKEELITQIKNNTTNLKSAYTSQELEFSTPKILRNLNRKL